MEWVETTGRTVDEAKEAALDELGVDEADAEFEVIAEAQTGLFGRLRSEARVRARVRPTAPRAKDERRDRRRRTGHGARSAGSGNADDGGRSESASTSASASLGASSIPTAGGPSGTPDAVTGTVITTAVQNEDASQISPNGRSSRRRRSRRGNDSGTTNVEADPPRPNGAEVDVPLDEQARIAKDFLAQLTEAFGLSASVSVARPDEETAELQLTGSDLGLLIGAKGATLAALQNLTRTVVFHETAASNGHLNVDIGGYRHQRTQALIRFAKQIASTVNETGSRTALEPMSAVDRKVVHDAVAEIDGVMTISEGEEPNRRVVVLPASHSA
jgi:spoIIIJ-associated protein